VSPDPFAAYPYCPPYGSAYYHYVQPRQRSYQPNSHTDFNNPIIAVAILILDPGNNLLPILRAKDSAMPDGFVVTNERLQLTVHREISTEIGLDLNSPALKVKDHPD